MTPFRDLVHAEDYGARVLAAIDHHDKRYEVIPPESFRAKVLAADRAHVRDCLNGLTTHRLWSVSARCITCAGPAYPCPDAARYAAILHRLGTTYGVAP